MSFFISTHYTLFLTIWEISYKEINAFIKESYDKFGYGNSINTISELASMVSFENWWNGMKLIFGKHQFSNYVQT